MFESVRNVHDCIIDGIVSGLVKVISCFAIAHYIPPHELRHSTISRFTWLGHLHTRAPGAPSPRLDVASPITATTRRRWCSARSTASRLTTTRARLNWYRPKRPLTSSQSACWCICSMQYLHQRKPHSRVPGFCEHQHQLGG